MAVTGLLCLVGPVLGRRELGGGRRGLVPICEGGVQGGHGEEGGAAEMAGGGKERIGGPEGLMENQGELIEGRRGAFERHVSRAHGRTLKSVITAANGRHRPAAMISPARALHPSFCLSPISPDHAHIDRPLW